MADLKKLNSVFKVLKKDMGDGIIYDELKNTAIERFPLSSPALADLFGKGGLPKGRIVELYGMESSGKTLISTLIGKYIQNLSDGFVCLVDAEYSFDFAFAEGLGLNTSKEKFLLVKPDYGEQGLEAVLALVESGEIDLIIVDSVSALVPKAESEATMEDMQMGAQARMLGKFFRKAIPVVARTKTTVIFINQIRATMAFMGPKTTTSGGNALKFYASIRLQVKRLKNIGEADSVEGLIGIKTSIKCTKNKTSSAQKTKEIEIFFDGGIDTRSEYVDFGILYSVIQKSGAWYTLPVKDGDGVLVKLNGSAKVVDFYKNNEKAMKELENSVISIMSTKITSGKIRPEKELKKTIVEKAEETSDNSKKKVDNIEEAKEGRKPSKAKSKKGDKDAKKVVVDSKS